VGDKKNVVIGAGVFVAVLGVGLLLNRTKPAPKHVEDAPALSAPVTEAAPSKPSGPPLPKLEESDPYVRGKADELSADPRFKAALKTEELIPRFVSVLGLIAAGKVPTEALSFLAPKGKFAVKKQSGKIVINPRTYARFDAPADIIASVNARTAATLFGTFKPLLQQAYGAQGADVSDLLARALAEVVSTPVVSGDIVLVPSEKGITYVFADEALEALTPAQKVLLRMGPQNEAKVQAKAKELAAALGFSDARLKK
jgi:hypothetical protein